MIIHGDSIEVLKTFEANSIDALVTDPPYGLGDTSPIKVKECLQSWLNEEVYETSGKGFMQKDWDKWVPSPSLWKEVYRVLKPGAYGLVFSGSRTEDLMSISLRLAGFEIRDRLVWLYGSGFPKSHNIAKAIDKHHGREFKAIPASGVDFMNSDKERWNVCHNQLIPLGEQTEEAKEWEGWGTALKPAYEPIILVRKPLEGTVVDNVLKYGVGGINIDECRIETDRNLGRLNKVDKGMYNYGNGANNPYLRKLNGLEALGLWPANILLDQSINDPQLKRYFYCAKASPSEREAGLEHLQKKTMGMSNDAIARIKRGVTSCNKEDLGYRRIKQRSNIHPTVKPISLMRYLCKLITPKDGTVIEPFAGSGTTLCAAVMEGFKPIGIEREEEYIDIIKARLKHWSGGQYDMTEEPPQPKTGEQLSLF
jgi:site-specific DNA-methyltransferase (adenine-specific)